MKAEKLGLRPGDAVIYAVLALLCAALFALPLLQQEQRPLTAQIVLDGEVIETVDLSSLQGEETRTVRGCTIVLSQTGVRVAEADCPDKLCVKTGEISRAGEAAACVPNRVVVSLKRAAGTDAYDGVAY